MIRTLRYAASAIALTAPHLDLAAQEVVLRAGRGKPARRVLLNFHNTINRANLQTHPNGLGSALSLDFRLSVA